MILHSKCLFEYGHLKLIFLMVAGGMAKCLTSLSLKKVVFALSQQASSRAKQRAEQAQNTWPFRNHLVQVTLGCTKSIPTCEFIFEGSQAFLESPPSLAFTSDKKDAFSQLTSLLKQMQTCLSNCKNQKRPCFKKLLYKYSTYNLAVDSIRRNRKHN